LNEDLLTTEESKAYVLEYFQKNDIEIEGGNNNIRNENLNKIIEDYKLSEVIQVSTGNFLNSQEKIKKLLKNYSASIAENIAEDWNLDFNAISDEYNKS
jgi:RNA polymerase-interacting CarD/CdnL/TRCF family regulator